jgi:hypothetical protein
MRGTAANEAVVSQANTPEFEQGYERVFGNLQAQRGRWVWDAELGELVRSEDYRPQERALDAPIMTGRFYEGTQVDGRDLGSRARYRDYLKETGCANASDYRDHWSERKAQKEHERHDRKDRKEAVGRAVYEVIEKGKRPVRRYLDDPT